MAQDRLSLRAPQKEMPAGSPDILIILIGERSLGEVGQWPWPRSKHIHLLETLRESRLVIFDMVMPELSDPLEDDAFAEAVALHGRVVMGLYVGGQAAVSQPVYPYPDLLEASAGIGVVNAMPDRDGIIRRHPMLFESGGLNFPSLSLAAAAILSPDEPVFQQDGKKWRMHWEGESGPPPLFPELRLDENRAARFSPTHLKSIKIYEYIDVINGLVPPERLKNAVVLVGSSGAGTADLHRMPGGNFVPGSSLIALGLGGIMSGHTLDKAPAFYWLPLMLCLCAAALWAGRQRSITRGSSALFAVCLAWLLGWGGLLWWQNLFIPLSMPLLSAALLFSATTGLRLLGLEREWAVRALPLDEILFAPTKLKKTGKNFQDYLQEAWPKIERLSGLNLIAARVAAEDESLAPCLAAVQEYSGSQAAHGLIVLPHFSPEHPRHRLLIPLPFAEEESFTLAAWSGKIPPESLKSAAALVVSIAMQYTLLEEQEKRQNMLFSTIRAISGAIDAKDPVTAGHSERVAELSRNIALWMGWEQQDADDVFLSGILHDVGKIGVPDAVLNKPGKLSPAEFDSMKTHPAKGHAIMLPIDMPSSIVRGILEHHERVDGRGYPAGLSGDAISQVARIIKIADVYDALISERQYKEPWLPEKACNLIYSKKGTEFDTEAAEAFLRHMAPPGWQPPKGKQNS